MGGFDVIDPRYQRLYDRTRQVLGADDRVLDVVVSGSVATGDADRWSDLDLAVTVRREDHEAFVAEWPVWLAAITPTVFARTPIAPFIVNAVTDEGLTLDIAIYSGEVPAFRLPTTYAVGNLASLRFDDLGNALEYAVAEQLRGVTGPFVSLVQRDEHIRHLTGVPHLLGLLMVVFFAETGAPAPGKRVNASLTAEQRATVAALPPVSASRDDIVAFGLAVAELVVRRARPLYPRYGLTWPHDLATVAARRLQDQLGIDAADWLY